MQPVVEPDLGLCGNLKPNRFFGTERKRFYWALLLQGPLFYNNRKLAKRVFYSFTKGGYTKMDILQQSALAWKELTEYQYQFVYGYRKTLYPINLTFSFEDYPHLADFQYLKDVSLPNYTSSKIVERILEGKIAFEQIQKAAQYSEMVKPRLEALIHLKNSLTIPLKTPAGIAKRHQLRASFRTKRITCLGVAPIQRINPKNSVRWATLLFRLLAIIIVPANNTSTNRTAAEI